jgi:hypothetical protein
MDPDYGPEPIKGRQTIPGRCINPVKLAMHLMSLFGEEPYQVSVTRGTYEIQAPRWLSEVRFLLPAHGHVKSKLTKIMQGDIAKCN